MMDAKYELVLDTSSVLNSFVFALTQSVYRALSQKFYFNLHDKGFVIFSKEANCENGTGGVGPWHALRFRNTVSAGSSHS